MSKSNNTISVNVSPVGSTLKLDQERFDELVKNKKIYYDEAFYEPAEGGEWCIDEETVEELGLSDLVE